MMQHNDFLVEIHTEELPPKALLKLAQVFCQQIKERLEKAELAFNDIKFFATPRRLAVQVLGLAATQPDQVVERKGPALSAAFDADGKPSPACAGFARSCGIEPSDLIILKTSQGEWVGFKQTVTGKSVNELLPAIVEQALTQLPIPKRMRWGANTTQFVRPVHAVIMLYGADIIPATILGCTTDRKTRGHRFHAPEWIAIKNASTYAEQLKNEGHVIADFAERRAMIQQLADEVIQQQLKGKGSVLISSDALLDEVTNLVEWPVALCGQFDEAFLQVPKEVLISSMQDHQRYFPVIDANQQLLPYFITMSNIQSEEAARVIHGNERVLRARLSDAAFFYHEDQKQTLEARLPILKGIVFQAKLGSLYDKAERTSQLAGYLAKQLTLDAVEAKRAAMLAKTDLITNMVNEFPELQGLMGSYYAKHDGESDEIIHAMSEQYMPRYAGDVLPQYGIGQVLALADRLDTLLGTFGINQIPTGDKDPYGLRRAALGVLRIILEKKIDLDLQDLLTFAATTYATPLENKEAISQVLHFMQERLRTLYIEQGVTPDVFASVAALGVARPLDVDQRIHAVQAFKKLNEADALSAANKRVSNILAKYEQGIEASAVSASLFEVKAEQALAEQIAEKQDVVSALSAAGKYDQVLLQLAELRKPVDDFFDEVMVMTDDKSRRENRLLLLGQLRALFLQVADIALLQ